MKKVAERLYRSEPEDPFGRGDCLTHAFFIARPNTDGLGNVLIYSSGQLAQDEKHIRTLGGITRQYLNHRDEAAAHCDWVSQTFGSKLICHVAEREAIEKHCTVHETIDAATELAPDLVAVPTPGHCPGSTCYLWNGPDARYLFPGDTIYFDKGDWQVFIDPANAQEMIRSLRVIAALEFDVLLPGLYQGDVWRADVTKGEAVERINEIVERLERGERH